MGQDMEHTVKSLSDRIKVVWGCDLDSALKYASEGCRTAPPQMCGVSADFFYDLLMLAKVAASEKEKQDP